QSVAGRAGANGTREPLGPFGVRRRGRHRRREPHALGAGGVGLGLAVLVFEATVAVAVVGSVFGVRGDQVDGRDRRVGAGGGRVRSRRGIGGGETGAAEGAGDDRTAESVERPSVAVGEGDEHATIRVRAIMIRFALDRRVTARRVRLGGGGGGEPIEALAGVAVVGGALRRVGVGLEAIRDDLVPSPAWTVVRINAPRPPLTAVVGREYEQSSISIAVDDFPPEAADDHLVVAPFREHRPPVAPLRGRRVRARQDTGAAQFRDGGEPGGFERTVGGATAGI